jgi:uncharacterized protein (DUF1330 family)
MYDAFIAAAQSHEVPRTGREDRSEMPAFLVSENLEVTDPAKLEEYREKVIPIIQQFGGRFRTAAPGEAVEGDWAPQTLVIIEFDDMATLRAWYDSAEYAPVKPLRHEAMRGNVVFVDGL